MSFNQTKFNIGDKVMFNTKAKKSLGKKLTDDKSHMIKRISYDMVSFFLEGEKWINSEWLKHACKRIS